MKTTVEIAEDLFARTREVAQREGTTLRTLIEEGLQVALARREQKAPYRWPDLSVDGEGLAPRSRKGVGSRFVTGSTHPNIFRPPTELPRALEQVAALLASPSLILLSEPTGFQRASFSRTMRK
jgi:hypothetical protein